MEGMSEREYSAHSGLSRGAIQKARKASRLPSVPLGGPATVGTREGRSMRSFALPWIPHDDVILPGDIQGQLALGVFDGADPLVEVMNEKKLYRIYREEGLSVPRRRGRKRARGSRTPMRVPVRLNQRWSLDFLSDTFGACRKFRILAVNDDCCAENLGLIADTSISGAKVAR